MYQNCNYLSKSWQQLIAELRDITRQPIWVSFSYFEDEDYIGRTEGNYLDRYDRVGGISYSEICD